MNKEEYADKLLWKDVDPRGPIRKIVSVDAQPEATYLTLDCGHINPHNQIYMYWVGHECRCFACGKESRVPR